MHIILTKKQECVFAFSRSIIEYSCQCGDVYLCFRTQSLEHLIEKSKSFSRVINGHALTFTLIQVKNNSNLFDLLLYIQWVYHVPWAPTHQLLWLRVTPAFYTHTQARTHILSTVHVTLKAQGFMGSVSKALLDR